MRKRHWLLVLLLMCVVIHITAAADVKKKKSSTKKKSSKGSKSTKASRAKNIRAKPQADVPISNGDDFEEDYDYDYDLGMLTNVILLRGRLCELIILLKEMVTLMIPKKPQKYFFNLMMNILPVRLIREIAKSIL